MIYTYTNYFQCFFLENFVFKEFYKLFNFQMVLRTICKLPLLKVMVRQRVVQIAPLLRKQKRLLKFLLLMN